MGEPQGPHRLRKLALSPGPLRIVPLPRSNRQRERQGGIGCCPAGPRRRAKYASDIEPLDPRQHPPPCVYVHLSVDGLYTCCWCTLRDDDDDFDACSTAAIVDHLREHRGCRTPTFPLMPATICRLTPPKKDAWIRSRQGLRIMTTGADAGRRASRSARPTNAQDRPLGSRSRLVT